MFTPLARAIFLCFIPVAGSVDLPAAPRPNIVLIMADDMGYSDIGCYGGEIQTPNLDRLAAEGLRFTDFYNVGRCCPTRASLMTGLYPHETGVGWMMTDWNHPGYRGDLNRSCVTIAEALKPAGYATYMSGKWHLTRQRGHWTGDSQLMSKDNWPRQRGFDRFYGVVGGGGSYYKPPTLALDNTPIPPDTKDFYFTDAISDKAVEYIRDHFKSQSNKPFFLYLSYTASHWPLHAPEAEIAKYRGRYNAGWDLLRSERYRRMLRMGLLLKQWTLTPRDDRVPAWESVQNRSWQARRMEVYAAQVDVMDQGIGRVIQALKQTRSFANTLILFLADNGGCAEEIPPEWKRRRLLSVAVETRDQRPVQIGNLEDVTPGPEDTFQSYGRSWANASNTPFRLYKHYVHEGGIATPLIAHWPQGLKTKAGSLTRQPGHAVDVMATALELADATYPREYKGNPIRPLQGESLLSVLQGRRQKRGPIYWEHEGHRAVREDMWKLVSKFPGKWELYDLEADRTETTNVSGDHSRRVKSMAAKYETWARRSQVLPWEEANLMNWWIKEILASYPGRQEQKKPD